MEKYINDKVGELPIQRLLQQLSLNDLLWSYDSNSLYPMAMNCEKSIHPKIETGYAFTPDLNDEIVKKFNEVIFKQGSAF